MAGIGSEELKVSFKSMASTINLWVVGPDDTSEAALVKSREIFEKVAKSCTRFDEESSLMKANKQGKSWASVEEECYLALVEAHRAYELTNGLFDPRVLDALKSYGYGQTLNFENGKVETALLEKEKTLKVKTWKPKFDSKANRVKVGTRAIDLGGIGKGLAVRWASEVLKGKGEAYLVEAGGDLMAGGKGPDGDGWLVSVENPFTGEGSAAVLTLVDKACATSSTRVRSWVQNGTRVHHLIDPRTLQSANSNLVSVTVVGPDPAMCEVWSKALFIEGKSNIRAAAEREGLAVLWVDEKGQVSTSRIMNRFVTWKVNNVK